MYEMTTRVGLSDVGPDGLMRYDAIIRAMVDCACAQTQDHVYDIAGMTKKHLGWFVVSWQVRLYDAPALCDRLMVRTYPYSFSGFIGKRHFAILTETGETAVTANSLWTWMDIEHARPVRIPDDFAKKYGMDDPPTEKWRGRKLSVPDDMEEKYDFNVSPMFLDTNGHMNNSYYVSAASRCLPDGCAPKEFYVEYRKQAMPDDRVIVKSAQTSDEITCTLNDGEGSTYAVVKFEL